MRLALLDLSLSRQETDMGIVSGLGQVVANFELIFLPAKLAGNLCGKVIRKGQEDLCAEGLQKRAPSSHQAMKTSVS